MSVSVFGSSTTGESGRVILTDGGLLRRLAVSVVIWAAGGVAMWGASVAGRPGGWLGVVSLGSTLLILAWTRVSVIDRGRREVRRFRLVSLGLAVERYPLEAFREVVYYPTRRGPDSHDVRGPVYPVGLQGDGVLEVTRDYRWNGARRKAERLARFLGLPLVDETVAPAGRREAEDLDRSLTEGVGAGGREVPAGPEGSTAVDCRALGDELRVEFPSVGVRWGKWLPQGVPATILLLVVLGSGAGVGAGSGAGALAQRGLAAVLGLWIVGATVRFVLLAPRRWGLRISSREFGILRHTALGTWTRRFAATEVQEATTQNETIVVMLRRQRIVLPIRPARRLDFADLPADQQAAIRAGRRAFPPSPDAQWVVDLIRHGLAR